MSDTPREKNIIGGLEAITVSTLDESLRVLKGALKRETEEMELNTISSRSHAIIRMTITQVPYFSTLTRI